MKEYKICALARLHIGLEIGRIKMELCRQVLVDALTKLG